MTARSLRLSSVAIGASFQAMQFVFATAAIVVNFVACLSYVRAVLKAEATPNRVTWFLWAIVPLIAGAAQLRSGVGISTLVVVLVGAGPA